MEKITYYFLPSLNTCILYYWEDTLLIMFDLCTALKPFICRKKRIYLLFAIYGSGQQAAWCVCVNFGICPCAEMTKSYSIAPRNNTQDNTGSPPDDLCGPEMLENGEDASMEVKDSRRNKAEPFHSGRTQAM